MPIHVRSTPAERASDREKFENIFPGFNRIIDECATKLEDAGRDILSDAIGFRRLIVGSPYERLVLAGRLLDMCEDDAAELLNREIDPLTFDDVLAAIEGLAAKVRALKERAELPKAAE
jgi:hypothetical protein